jgi:hypothetical protein
VVGEFSLRHPVVTIAMTTTGAQTQKGRIIAVP